MTAIDHPAVRPQTSQPHDSSAPARRVAGWLRGREARMLDDAGLLASLGRHLRDGGLGLDRLLFHVGTLHPEIFARVLAWTAGEPVEIYEQDHPATVAAGFPESPFRRAAASRDRQVARGLDPQCLGRAGGHLVQSRGIGEIVSAPFERDGRNIVVSFCAARPNVFGTTDHLTIDGVIVSLQQIGRRPVGRPLHRQ